MDDTMIITGWGTDYACAAAIALQKFPDAVVRGMSRRRLPEFLAELAGRDKGDIRRIFILGVSLGSSPDQLLAALKKLKRQGIKITWISVFPLPEFFPKEVGDLAEIAVAAKAESLSEAVLGHFQLSSREARAGGMIRLVRIPESRREDADLARIRLLEAAASRYRRFQDEKSYPDAIASLAMGKAPNEAQAAMVEEYRKFGRRELKGRSPAVAALWEIVSKVGKDGSCRVLITGETGTGKETVASLIHGKSPRAPEPFIAFNCADLSPQLLESRLFGHEKGAFTGAEKQRKGAFELANGGTLFLDEVAELPPDAQAGLLRVLQEGRFSRLGSETEIEVDVRIIAATNRSLPEMVAKGEFREDLFFRLNVVHIHIPPLRERPEDIAVIANDYLRNKGLPKLSERQTADLLAYGWPGNVRELQNILDRAAVLGLDDFGTIIANHRKSLVLSEKLESDELDGAIRRHVKKVLDKKEGNKTHAAKTLGISLNTLKKYLK